MGLCISRAAVNVATREAADGGLVDRVALQMVSKKHQGLLAEKLQAKEARHGNTLSELSARFSNMRMPEGG